MKRSLKNVVAGALAVTGVLVATVDVQAMPVQPLQSSAAATNGIEHVWWRGGYGWRGYGWRGGWRGYGWRRPIYYGYGWGWRRPYYGWRRGWGWRRW